MSNSKAKYFPKINLEHLFLALGPHHFVYYGVGYYEKYGCRDVFLNSVRVVV